MTAPTIRPNDIELALRAGKTPQQVERELTVPIDVVLQVQRRMRNGSAPAPAARPAPPPAEPAGGSIGQLLLRSADIPEKRIQTARARADKAITALRALVAEYESAEAARAEVARLQRELAAAKAKLRPAATPKAGSGGGLTREQSRAIRAWARAVGVDCPAVGCVPRRVVEAYDAAQGSGDS